MKKLLAFFVMLWKLIAGLFKKSAVSVPVAEKFEEAKTEVQHRFAHPVIPPHNNRKRTRGRCIQVAHFKSGEMRTIYHGSTMGG